MSAWYGGGFNPQKPQRVKTHQAAVSQTQQGLTTFSVRPGSSTHSVMQTPTSHPARTQGTSWNQQIATPSQRMSTKYDSLFKNLSTTDLGRAHKAYIRGGADTMPSTQTDHFHGKSYSGAAMQTAVQFRLNETTSAFGSGSFGDPTRDAGQGIMAEVMSQKWSARAQGHTAPAVSDFQDKLIGKYPQLDTVDKMRNAGPEALSKQIQQSRFEAAVAAGVRGYQKGHGSQIGEYVQAKFNKHALGQLDSGMAGWAAQAQKVAKGLTHDK